MELHNFNFSRKQALIVAQWQVGVRNYLLPAAVIPYALPLAGDGLRALRGDPSLKFTPVLRVAAAIYALLIAFLIYRVAAETVRLRRMSLAMGVDGERLVINRAGELVFKARLEDISRVDCGAEIVRVATRFGAACLPAGLIPPPLLQRWREAPEILFREYKWM